MTTNTLQLQDKYFKLQADVDKILEDVHHLFDDIAEYSSDNDPSNVIDLDKVLKMSTSQIAASNYQKNA